MWFRYNASRSGVTAAPLAGERAADRRVTNHDGWEFNELPTQHTRPRETNCVSDHLVGRGGADGFVSRCTSSRGESAGQPTEEQHLMPPWKHCRFSCESLDIKPVPPPGCQTQNFHLLTRCTFSQHMLSPHWPWSCVAHVGTPHVGHWDLATGAWKLFLPNEALAVKGRRLKCCPGFDVCSAGRKKSFCRIWAW